MEADKVVNRETLEVLCHSKRALYYKVGALGWYLPYKSK
jgi:hypothetical protein